MLSISFYPEEVAAGSFCMMQISRFLKEMIHATVREPLERWFCCCVSEDQGLFDDGNPVLRPTRIGLSMLFYGKRKSYFPFHCMVGPDWIFVAFVFAAIIVINIVILYVISPIGWIPVVIGLVGAICLLVTYAQTVFSDPGIIYKNDFTPQVPTVSYTPPDQTSDIESNSNRNEKSPFAVSPNTVMPSVPHTIECGQCDLRRPYTARHCEYCKVCIDNLDHHCPW